MILTSNRTRELHDALKRRCLYHWIDHPTVAREIQIVELRVPGVPDRLAAEAARFAAELRSLDLQKPPGLAETIDWVQALTALGQQELDVENVQATLGSLLKYHEICSRFATRRSQGSSSRPVTELSDAGAARRRPARRLFGRVLREGGLESGRVGSPTPCEASTRSISAGRTTCTGRSARRRARARGPRDVRPRVRRVVPPRREPLRLARASAAAGRASAGRAACRGRGLSSTAARSRWARGATTSSCARGISPR